MRSGGQETLFSQGDVPAPGSLAAGTAEHDYFHAGMDELSTWVLGVTNPASPEAQVVDLFSGCGGMSLGFAAVARATGAFRVVGAADLNEVSAATYAHNFGVSAQALDVRRLAEDRRAMREFLSQTGSYDSDLPLVLIGCAPCQGFSAHSKKNWGSAPDERNNLIGVFAQIVAQLAPACVIMENVPELLSARHWERYEHFRDRLQAEGYTVKQAIHNAAHYGVPQERFRALVVAMRQDDFSLPLPVFAAAGFRTVRDAIMDLPSVAPGDTHPLDTMHRSASHRASTLDIIRAVPKDGGSRPRGTGNARIDNFKGFYDVYGRLSWDKPAITITHYARNPASGRFVHPEQDRGLTQREAARLQGFPDGFEFRGTFDDVFRQIGEAVAPPFSVAIAASTLANLRGENVADQPQTTVDSPVSDSFAGVIAGIKAKQR